MGVLERRRERRAARALGEPVVRCLSPLDAEQPIAHNALLIRGYALGPNPIAEAFLEVDGSRIPLPYGSESPEARSAFPGIRAAEQAGFEWRLDTSAWSPGTHTISIGAIDDAGATAAWRGDIEAIPFEAPVTGLDQLAEGIRAGFTRMQLEAPAPGAAIARGEYFEARGWAYCRAGIREVVITIDDRLRFAANHGLRRDDLDGAVPGVDLSRSGFTVRIDPRVLDSGEHVITAVAIGEDDGRPIGMRWTFVVASPESVPSARPEQPEIVRDLAEAKLTISPAAEQDARTPEATAFERFVPEVHGGQLIDAEHQARYRWAAQAAAGRRALDAACGAGYGTAILAAAGAASAIGIDIEARAVLQARERHPGLRFEVADLHELPFGDTTFDLIACFEAIEHVSDPERALDEIRRVLAPDGLLLISSPNRGVFPPGHRWHVHEYKPDELAETLGRRFVNVRLHRQRSHLATMVSDDATFAVGDSAADLGASVRKISADVPGEELYSLAAASDARLPELRSIAMLAKQDFDVQAWHGLANAWQARAVWAESEAAASRAEAAFANYEKVRLIEQLEPARAAQATLDSVVSSASWRLTRPLRALKRIFR